MTRAVLFSRILSVLGALAAAGVALWFVSTSLAPVKIPPAPLSVRSSVQFDANADVSKNQAFKKLSPSPVTSTVPATVGRENPFSPPTRETEFWQTVVPYVPPMPATTASAVQMTQ
jgi:hypothetical protein